MKAFSRLMAPNIKFSTPLRFPHSRPLPAEKLERVYQDLRRAFGHQDWWPGESPFEIIVGAILTQNTAWTNVEKAIANLKRAGCLNPRSLFQMKETRLAQLIKPAGFFNIKARRLKNFLSYFFERYQASIKKMRAQDASELRGELLSISGIGPETADAILLYALEKPYFVIDAYTKRIFSRHQLQAKSLAGKRHEELSYADWQKVFMDHLPREIAMYNDFHAQIVLTAKRHCKASAILCSSCPLQRYL